MWSVLHHFVVLPFSVHGVNRVSTGLWKTSQLCISGLTSPTMMLCWLGQCDIYIYIKSIIFWKLTRCFICLSVLDFLLCMTYRVLSCCKFALASGKIRSWVYLRSSKQRQNTNTIQPTVDGSTRIEENWNLSSAAVLEQRHTKHACGAI